MQHRLFELLRFRRAPIFDQFFKRVKSNNTRLDYETFFHSMYYCFTIACCIKCNYVPRLLWFL